ncbi:MAG: GGDEF domain-containing protein, partial [Thiohalorhabdaceae bacterium]
RRFGHPFSLIYFDLDDFKAVNDHRGHRSGDYMLRIFVKTLEERIRSIDSLARPGGDEFALLLPESDKPEALRVLARLNQASVRSGGVPSFSSGVLVCQDPGTLPAEPATAVDRALDAADQAMYRAK